MDHVILNSVIRRLNTHFFGLGSNLELGTLKIVINLTDS